MNQPIEKMSVHELLKEWQSAIGSLQGIEKNNPNWEWKSVQLSLERLHALAREIHAKKAQERAKWQP